MNLTEYQTLSGVTVASADNTRVTAQILRTQAILETMLGFTLNSKKVDENLYNELGKTTQECSCPSVDDEELEDPDEVVGAYRLYRFNILDQYFHIDPFTQLNAVKLVYLRQGEEPNGVTVKTYEIDEIRVQGGRGGFSRFIEPSIICECGNNENIQIAVDAEWMFDNCLPTDLKYVWVDMVTYYSDLKNNIKSESINTHSYTKDNVDAPEEKIHNLNIIKRYAGPYGSVTVEPTQGVR